MTDRDGTTSCSRKVITTEQHQQEEEENTGGDSASSSINTTTMTVGGAKGHVVEVIHDDNAALLIHMFRTYRWKPIPNCTGRYTCRDHHLVTSKRPKELLLHLQQDVDGASGSVLNFEGVEFDIPGRNDKIIVLSLDNDHRTGIITYVKKKIEREKGDNSDNNNDNNEMVRYHYVHTLNTPSGFRRKLNAIGIHVTAESFQLDKCGKKDDG